MGSIQSSVNSIASSATSVASSMKPTNKLPVKDPKEAMDRVKKIRLVKVMQKGGPIKVGQKNLKGGSK